MAALTTSRPESSASHQTDVMQSRLAALEYENKQLRASLEDNQQAMSIERERDEALEQKSVLDEQISNLQRSLDEKSQAMEALHNDYQSTYSNALEKLAESDKQISDLRSQLNDSTSLVSSLKASMEDHEVRGKESSALIQAKESEITSLDSRVAKLTTELETEKRELGAQVYELRSAGQETIALYEERLSAAESQRYELQDRIALLEKQKAAAATPLSPTTASKRAASAAEIDNEALRDQVSHLQNKILKLEDELEDAHSAAEREEAAVTERLKRYREKEDTVRLEVEESKKEVERVAKAERMAKEKLEEVEEAFREASVALEDAQAEIENMRNEIAVCVISCWLFSQSGLGGCYEWRRL